MTLGQILNMIVSWVAFIGSGIILASIIIGFGDHSLSFKIIALIGFLFLGVYKYFKSTINE